MLSRNTKNNIIYTGLFLLMCTAAFFPFYQEGKSFIWAAGVEDGLSQHFSALAYYGSWLREIVGNLLHGQFEIPMWNMSLGYGADIIQTLNYYAIGDPLNLLYGFVPVKYTETMYHFMILLRMYLAGITFMIYCRKLHKRDYGTVLGALTYVFCGFCFRLGLRHPFFLNPMIYFPLLCLGIEKIYKKENPAVFILAVFVSAVSNYYFLYMLTIFAVIYAWIRFYGYVKKDRIRNFFRVLGRFTVYYALGIGMAAVILIPSVIGFLGNGRNGSGVDLRTLLLYPGRFYVLFLENITGYGNAGSNTNTGYLPIAGIAILYVLFSNRMKHKKYKAAFAACMIGIALPIFGFAFNGFSYASNRWSFILSFIVAMLVAELYPRFFMMSGRQRIGIAVGIFLYNVFLWTVKSCGIETLGSRGARTSGLLLIIFYIGFFLFQKYKLDSYHILPKIIMAVFMILSVGIHGYYRFSMDGEAYVKEFLNVGTALESLEPQGVKMLKSVEDDGLYRVHAEGYRYKNYGLLNHLNTISGYYSITAAETTDTIKSYETLGMKYADKYHGLDQRLGLLSLAGVKYMTVSEEGHVDRWTKSCGDVPYGFQKLKTQGDISLYENPYALPFGYGYDSYITKKQYDALNGVGREQAMLKNAVVEEELKNTDLREEKVFDNVSVTTIPLSEKRISSPNGKEYADVSVPVNADKEIYLYFKNLIYEDNISNGANLFMHGKKGSKGIIVEQNGIRKKIHIQSTFNPYYFGRKDYMIKLNHHETSGKEKVRLKFLSPGTYQFKQMYLVVVDKDATLAKIKNLQHNTLKDIELDDNRFSGRMIAEKENMVCITIPYSKGWRATVDGKKAEIHKINGMYMGVLVKKGNHRIELDYTTPGIRIGCIISIVVWGMFFCLERILMKNKRICSKDIEGLDNKDENGIIETENYDELQKYGGK